MAHYNELSKEELLGEKKQLGEKFEQYVRMGLKLNMARGVPGSDQLDLSLPLFDALGKDSDFRCETGADCRNYGVLDGIPEAKQMFADLFGVSADQIIIGGNSSLTLMFDTVCTAMVKGVLGGTPWIKQGKIKFLCPCPGYDRHFAITEYFDVEMIPIEMRDDGPDMDTVERLVSSDPQIKGIWCVPKYANPTGVTYSDETVRRFAALRPAAEDFRIFWDNAYCVHHLFGDDAKLLNIIDECEKAGNPNMVYMFYSTSKITFPGAGVAGMAASLENIADIKSRMKIQTIGYDKLNQLRHVRFFGDYKGLLAHMDKHAEILRPKFAAVDETLSAELGDTGVASWSKPAGGYFVSLNVMPGCAARVVDLCREAGVTLTGAGATYPYHRDPRDENIRIAPTSQTVEVLRQAMEILSVCVRMAAVDKLLSDK